MAVFDARGRSLALRGPGRSGGEGTVYAIESMPGVLAKIYHREKLNAELHEKIAAMASSPPKDPAWLARRHRSIAWVEQLLYADPNRSTFIGFTMPAIDTGVFREAHAYYDPADRLRRFGGGFTWRHLLATACNLSSSVAAVHAEGHRIGDMRETNILVAPSALISFIDCDSFQIRDHTTGRVFHTRVGTGEYLPPELHSVDFRDDHDRSASDLFALGVLIFKFLMQGVHPFQARGRLVDDAPSTEAKVRKGHYPYERRLRHSIEPPAYAPPYETLPPAVRALFHKCFVGGHSRPSKRPPAAEWFAVLTAESKRLRECPLNDHHAFGRHLSSCPWCKIARETGDDPFPSAAWLGGQVALKSAPARPGAPAQLSPVARAGVLQPPAVAPGNSPVGSQPGSTPRARGFFRGAWRVALWSVRSRARVAVLLIAILIGGAAASPLGHATGPVVRTHATWGARVRGVCPYDARRVSSPPEGCVSRWSLLDVTLLDQHRRQFFVLSSDRRRVRIGYAVTYSARDGGRCELPWVDNLTFNQRAPELCLSTCPERIELRAQRGGALYPLVAASGLGARTTPVHCGERLSGSWTFDIAGSRGPLVLHYPAFRDTVIPTSARAKQ